MLKSYNQIEPSLYISSALIAISLLSGFILSSSSSSADVVDDVVVTVPVSCNMASELDEAHTATINPGQYQSDIGTTNFTVFCNDNSGYAIYAIGYSNEEYGNTKMLATINNELSPTNDISTGTNTSGANSSWSMKLVPVTAASSGTEQPYTPTIESDTNGTFGDYHVVPAEYTKVAAFTSNTDFTIGSSLQSTYQVYIDGTKPAGTYAGKVKYTLVHPASEVPAQPQTTASGKICYYANATDAVGTMGCQNVASSVTLLASNFSRTGYGFAGWSDAFDYQTNENAKFYGPQETITLTPADYQSPNNGLSLYAVWVKSAGNIQSWNDCSNLTPANTATNILKQSITALSDARDDNTYAVARLADGNCWMIENLRLDNSATLTTTNTNNPLNDGINVTLKHNYADTETYNTLSASQDPTTTAWCNTDAASCDDQSMLFTGNTTNRKTDSANNDGNIYSYGNYYNWYSATAGRGTYSFDTNNSSVAGDLCPAGWHLPKGGRKANVNVSDFWKLSRATIGADPANFANDYFYYTGTPEGTDASNKMRAYPNNFAYSGYVGGGSVYNRGSYGYWWSSTVLSSGNAYYLGLSSSNVIPGTLSGNKYYGRTVRCVVSGV